MGNQSVNFDCICRAHSIHLKNSDIHFSIVIPHFEIRKITFQWRDLITDVNRSDAHTLQGAFCNMKRLKSVYWRLEFRITFLRRDAIIDVNSSGTHTLQGAFCKTKETKSMNFRYFEGYKFLICCNYHKNTTQKVLEVAILKLNVIKIEQQNLK